MGFLKTDQLPNPGDPPNRFVQNLLYVTVIECAPVTVYVRESFGNMEFLNRERGPRWIWEGKEVQGNHTQNLSRYI